MTLPDRSASYARTGNQLLDEGSTEARTWFDKALKIDERLLEQQPDNTFFLRNLADS